MNSTGKRPRLATPTSPKVRVGKLKTVGDVAKYIARCIRRGEGGVDGTRMYRQVMMASILLRAIEISSLEERVEALEDKAGLSEGRK
jgi:hypothetical protein